MLTRLRLRSRWSYHWVSIWMSIKGYPFLDLATPGCMHAGCIRLRMATLQLRDSERVAASHQPLHTNLLWQKNAAAAEITLLCLSAPDTVSQNYQT